MSSNGGKYATWTGLGIIVTILLFIIGSGFSMFGSFSGKLDHILELVYKLDSRTQILERITESNTEISILEPEVKVVNPYKKLENEKPITLDVFTNNLEKAWKAKEEQDEAEQRGSKVQTAVFVDEKGQTKTP